MVSSESRRSRTSCASTCCRPKRTNVAMLKSNAPWTSTVWSFDPDEYEVIVCVNVLEHARRPLTLFPVVRNALKEGDCS